MWRQKPTQAGTRLDTTAGHIYLSGAGTAKGAPTYLAQFWGQLSFDGLDVLGQEGV